MKLRIIYIGTGEIGAPLLECLARDPDFEICGVITGMDQKCGRGLRSGQNEIKKCALLNKLIIHQSAHISNLKNFIEQAKPDFLVLFSFGEIIPSDILSIPKIAPINIHASLLPRLRGASPIQNAILNGDKTSGITWMIMNEKMDEGDIIGADKINIDEDENYTTISKKLAEIAREKTPAMIKKFALNPISIPQKTEGISYCKRISKSDGRINFRDEDAKLILKKIKAYDPWPGCFTFLNNKRLKILKAQLSEQKIDAGIGIINESKRLCIGTKDKSVEVLEVQSEGRKPCKIKDFFNGLRLKSEILKFE